MSADLRLDWCAHEAAAFACRTWHYSRTVPAGKLVKIGVWEAGKFVGAVVFGRGANNNIGSRYGLYLMPLSADMRAAIEPLRQSYPKRPTAAGQTDEDDNGSTRTAADADEGQEGDRQSRPASAQRARGATPQPLETAGAYHREGG